MNDISKAATLRNYYETARVLPEGKDREEFMFAIMQYQFDGIEPEFKSQLAKIGFMNVKAIIDMDGKCKMKYVRLADEERKAVCAMWRDGARAADIAQRFNVSQVTVYNILNTNGIRK